MANGECFYHIDEGRYSDLKDQKDGAKHYGIFTTHPTGIMVRAMHNSSAKTEIVDLAALDKDSVRRFAKDVGEEKNNNASTQSLLGDMIMSDITDVTATLKKSLTGKLLYIDCETSLIELYAHCIGSKQNIGHHQIKKDKKIICICYMVEGDEKPSRIVWDSKHDDTELLDAFVKVATQYPVIVAQNGDQFDIKVIRGRCWERSAARLPDITTLDTLKMSRQNFKLTSHRLDWKSKLIGRDGKLSTDFQLWIDVQNGDKEALERMVTYCEQDVIELREVFLSMLPYCAKLPHQLGRLNDSDTGSCTLCGSDDVRKEGKRFKNKSFYQRYCCRNCGNLFVGSKALLQ